LGGFDTAIGSGAFIGSGNDVDVLYRAYRAHMKVVYNPDIVVFHNHGRRTLDEIRRLRRRYAIGRGALYAKHALRGDMEMAKMAYWEYRALLSETVRNGWREPAFFLGALTRGAIKRINYDLFARWWRPD